MSPVVLYDTLRCHSPFCTVLLCLLFEPCCIGLGGGEILIFNPQFACLSIFDIQFASLSIFDPAHTNSFNLRDYEGFLSFLISSCFFTLFRTLEMTILPSALIRWPRRLLSPSVCAHFSQHLPGRPGFCRRQAYGRCLMFFLAKLTSC